MRESWPRAVLAGIAVALVTAAAAAGGSVVATPISSDPYTNQSSQHRTQVEPDSFGYGNTVVATFQTGRFNVGGGSSNIGWATTTNAGRTWTTGMLPGTTVFAGRALVADQRSLRRVRPAARRLDDLDPDVRHGVDAVRLPQRDPDEPVDRRRTDLASPGHHRLRPGFYDKNWITCDTWPQSPHYGNCYQEWDDKGAGTAS